MTIEDPLKKSKEGMNLEQVEAIKKELAEFGLEVNEQNIEMVGRLINSKQVNEAEKSIYEKSKALVSGDFSVEEELKQMMQEKGITEIVHCEGPTVWDHVKLGLQIIDDLPIDEEQKKFYKIVFLYHDYGKTDETIIANNAEKNKNPLRESTGAYNISFVDHAHFEKMTDGAEAKVRAGLVANGIFGESADKVLWLLSYHMKGGIIEPKSKIANAAEIFNETDLITFNDLLTILQLDGQASAHYNVNTGLSGNDKKAALQKDKLLENISIYNGVLSLLVEVGEDDEKQKIFTKQKDVINKFFNQVNNFDEIDSLAIEKLKQQLKDIANPEEKKIEIPDQLKKIGIILGEKTREVAEVYPKLVKNKDNEKAMQSIVDGKLKNQLGLTDEQIQAVLQTL